MSGWPSKKKMSNYKFSWSQPYNGWPRVTLTPGQAAYTLAMLLAMHELDKEIDKSLTYPEAEAIIKTIANNSRGQQNA
jgi:hypothetical protein